MALAIFYTHRTIGTCVGMCACDRMHQMDKTDLWFFKFIKSIFFNTSYIFVLHVKHFYQEVLLRILSSFSFFRSLSEFSNKFILIPHHWWCCWRDGFVDGGSMAPKCASSLGSYGMLFWIFLGCHIFRNSSSKLQKFSGFIWVSSKEYSIQKMWYSRGSKSHHLMSLK